MRWKCNFRYFPHIDTRSLSGFSHLRETVRDIGGNPPEWARVRRAAFGKAAAVEDGGRSRQEGTACRVATRPSASGRQDGNEGQRAAVVEPYV